MGERPANHRLVCVFCLAVWSYWGFVKDAKDQRCPSCQGKRRHPLSPRREWRRPLIFRKRLNRLVNFDRYGKRGRRNRPKEAA